MTELTTDVSRPRERARLVADALTTTGTTPSTGAHAHLGDGLVIVPDADPPPADPPAIEPDFDVDVEAVVDAPTDAPTDAKADALTEAERQAEQQDAQQAEIYRLVEAALAGVELPDTPVYDAAKRALDIAVAGSLLVITSPVIGVIALIIRGQSPGPAVFRQRRVGKGGKVIRFCKFRTMYADAKERFPELYDYTFTEEQFATSFYKPAVDPRNTPFGRAVRKTTLDELPNLFNVIKGEVSLVGPRPELPDLIQYYTPEQLVKFSVKSGITGLAQVSGRNNLSIQEQIALDVEYVSKRSFLYDLRLIGRTAIMVVKRVGAE